MIRKAITALILIAGAAWALSTIHPAEPVAPISGTRPVSEAIDTPSLPPCEYEDGSGQSLCMWDASESGNGMGQDVIAGDCSIATVGAEASYWCLILWDMSTRVTYGENGSKSETVKGSVLVDDCLTIDFEMRTGEMGYVDGWNLAECFRVHIEE